MPRSSHSGSHHGSRPRVDLSAVLTPWASAVLKIALAGLVITYGYYVWAMVGGYLTRPTNVNPLILSNLEIMGRILFVASAAATLSLIYLTLDEVAWSVLAGVFGAWLVFGTPFLMAASVRGGQYESLVLVRNYTTWAGELILGLVALRVLAELAFYVASGPKLRPEEVEGEKFRRRASVTSKIWARCWEMPFCHQAVREVCPAYVNRKKCWKFGYGCMCNPKLIEALIRASTGGGGNAAKRTEGEYIRSDLEADVALSANQRTIPCSKCPIYAEHQRQKFKIVNPLTMVVTVGGLILAYRPLMGLYRHFVILLSNLAARFTLTGQVDPAQWFRYLDTPAVRVFFYVILGTVILAYVLKIVEWLVLEKKVI